ncbi:hypothetical protein [Kocuria rhizophila]|uniref:hypothetical protein n=1 Tax=Kocuria rhizophila TaxID=72000 RepID=UPI001909CC82|nr:hypothetical protein [Kocuria rhizophila]MBK4120920.1 hypothetical protein [Kocuria rhizophila]
MTKQHDAAPGRPSSQDGGVPTTVAEAVQRARAVLSTYLRIPESAARDLDRIDDGSPNVRAWASTTWRGLTALADYARDVREHGFTGGFWNWCVQQGAWPASPKKLAMSESQTVANNAQMSAKRVFRVAKAVEPSGEIFMRAHLKISEGGGDLAPRVYFYDDTAGKTRQVHVGFVGPHYLVPNSKA